MLHQLTFQNKNSGGYVALMSVLIISAVGTIVAISLLTLGMLNQYTSLTLEQGYKAQALANACANVALEKIHLDVDYLGNENIYFDTNSCNILPINKDENTYTVNTRGIVSSAFLKNKIIVTRAEDPETLEVTLTLVSWQEVADF
jgi:hypothetical protein